METMRDLVLECRRRYRDKTAIRYYGATRTYGELIDRACCLVNILHGLGITRGERVAVFVEDRIEAIEPYLACAVGGYIAVTVNRRLADREVALLLHDSDARALVHTDGLSAIVEKLAVTSELQTLTIGTVRPRGARDYEDELERASANLSPVQIAPTDPFMIAYTSGTTGAPKGAVLAHGRQVTATLATCANFRMPMHGEMAYSGSLSFPGAMLGLIFTTFLTGGAVRLFDQLMPDEWFDTMARDRSTVTFVPTPLMRPFVDLGRKQNHVLDHLASIVHAGGPANRDVAAEMIDLCGPKFLETWGMTEAGGAAVTVTSPSDRMPDCLADDPITTVGRNGIINRVYVVDDSGAELPPGSGQAGEIVTECDAIFTGYWNRPDETAKVLHDGHRYFTGDMGTMDNFGYVYLDGGRRAEMIVSGGMNVFPVEVEAVLLEHPCVAEVAVFARRDPHWGEAVTAAVQLRADMRCTEEQLIQFAKARLASYKKPSRVYFVEQMPRTASMKVKKHELRQHLLGY